MLKLKVLTINISISILLLFFLCLGSQNLESRHKVNFLVSDTVELPSGFIIGISFIVGVLSGGYSSSLMIKDEITIDN